MGVLQKIERKNKKGSGAEKDAPEPLYFIRMFQWMTIYLSMEKGGSSFVIRVTSFRLAKV